MTTRHDGQQPANRLAVSSKCLMTRRIYPAARRPPSSWRTSVFSADAVGADRNLLEELAEIRDATAEAPFEQSDSPMRRHFELPASMSLTTASLRSRARSSGARRKWKARSSRPSIDGRHQARIRRPRWCSSVDGDCTGGRCRRVRRQLRLALTERDRNMRLATLRKLASAVAQADFPPVTVAILGEGLLHAGDAKTAEAVLRPAQRQYPRHLELSLALAQTLDQLSRRPEAIRYYMMARAIQPQSGHSLAHALLSEHESDEAIAVFRDLIRVSPSVVRHYACLGEALRSMGRGREAEEVLDSGIAAGRETTKNRPDDPFAHFVFGTTLSRRGRLEEAISEFSKAIRLRPNYAEAQRNLGIARLNQKRFADAVVALREAIRLAPVDHQAHAALARAYEALGRRDDAVSELEETVRLKPNEAVAHFNLGLVLFHRGRLDEALAEYRAAINLNLGSADVHYNVGHILQLKGQVSESIAEYREAIRINPDYAEAHCNLANLLSTQGRYDEALAELERGHELGSKRADWPYPSAQWIEQVRRIARLRNSQQSENRK